MKKHYSNKKLARKPLITALEPRLLLDGAAVATALEAFSDAQLQQDAAQTSALAQDSHGFNAMAPTEARAIDPARNSDKKEVVFIDTQVADYQTLLNGMKERVEVVLLDGSKDGLAQMAAWAEGKSGYDAIHVMSHGAEGKVNLGRFSLDSITVNSRAADLAQLGAALHEDGDLLLYGCSVASGAGQDFIAALSQATQADVAASDDLTGAAVLGGDWELETSIGLVTTDAVLNAVGATSFSGILADATLTFESGTGSFSGQNTTAMTFTESATTSGVGFTFTANLAGGAADIVKLGSDYGQAYNGAESVYFGVDGQVETATMTIQSGGVFDLISLNLSNQGSGANSVADTFDITTSKNGVFTTQSIAVNASALTLITLPATAAFQGISWFSISPTTGDAAYLEIDDIELTNIIFSSNNAPTFTGAPADITVTEDTPSHVDLSGVTFADSDGDNLTVTLTASAGTLTASSGGSVTVSNSGTGTLTLSGTAANINTYLDTTTNIQYTGASNASGDNAATLTMKANDGTVDSSTSTVNIDITAVNDAPTAVSPTTGSVSTFDSANALVATVGATDVDDSTWQYSIQSITLNSVSQANDGSLFNFATDANTLTATNALRATTPSQMTAGTYMVTVVATDAGGLAMTQTISITVSDSLVVTTANDTSENAADAFNGNSYAAELADGGGLSLREALGLAQAGGKTISFAAGLNNANISLDSTLSVAANTIFQLANGTSFTISGQSLSLLGALTIDNGAGNTLTLSANLTDTGYDVSTLYKTGAGTLVLSGTNDTEETGLDTIVASAGQLQISNDDNLGSGNVTLSGGVTFATVGNILTVDNTFAIQEGGASFNQTGSGHLTLTNQVAGDGLLTKTGAGSLTLSENNDAFEGGVQINNGTLTAKASVEGLGIGTVTLNGGTLAFSDAGTVANAITVSADAAISNSANVTLSGQISGSATLTKAGAGTMTWSGNNTHSGAVTVSAGTLAVSGGSSIGNNSAVTVASGATLSLTGGNETIGSLAGAGVVSLTSNLTMGDSTNTIFSGVISSTNTSGIIKVGSGTLSLTGVNTYTGSTTISAGRLSLENGSAIANGSAVTINAGAELELRSSNETVGSLAGAGSLTLNGGTLTVGGDNTNTTFSGIIQDGASGGGLTKMGTGTLTLTGSNTYTGVTTVSAGTLVASHNNALGNISGTTTVSSGAALALADGVTIAENITIRGSGVSATGALRLDSGSATLSGNLTLSAISQIGAEAGASLTLDGVISGGTDLTKVRAGMLTLSGASTYTGATTVSAGTLLVTGSLDGTSFLTVRNGATLGGTGSIFANSSSKIVTISNGATLAPGVAGSNNGVGTLTINGNLSMASGSTLAVDITGATAGTGYDQVVVNGTVSVTNATITPTLSYTPVSGQAYVIINNDGTDSITGNFSGLNQGSTINSAGTVVALTGSYSGGTNTNDFTLTAPINETPTISNLNGDSVAWGGVGNYVTLDAGTALSVADTEFGSLNAGNGNWDGATLTISRVTSGGVADGTTKDLFSFLDNATFSVDQGSNPYTNYPVQSIEAAQAAGQNATGALSDKALSAAGQNSWFARWSYTYATGTLVVEFGTTSGDGDINVTPTTAQVAAVLQSIGYRNDTPYGDTAIRFSLSDGTTAATADVTVTSSTIYADAASDSDSEGDASDGFSLREALARGVSQGGFDTIKVVLANNTTYTLGTAATAGAGDTLDLSGANGVTITGSTLNLAGALTVTADASKTATISSALAGSGNLVKEGSGTLTLSGTNTHSGAVTISGGTLAVSGGSAVGDNSAVTVASGATLALNGNETFGSLAGTGSVTLGNNTLTTGGDNTSTTFSGAASGTGALTKIGSGTLILSGANSYTGATAVSAGTLALSGGSAIADSSAVTVAAGATLSLTGGNETIGSLAGAGAVSLSYTLTMGGSTSTVFSGVISSTNTSGINKVGSGTLSLTGANTYTGSTTISAGRLLLENGAAIADSSAVTVNAGAELELRSGETLGSLAGAGSLTLNGGSLTTGGNNNSTTFSGVIQDGGNGGGLTKIGTGTFTLTGSNTFSGDIAVLAGGLSIEGDSNLGSGALTLNSGTLSVTGDGANIDNAISLLSNGGVLNVGTGATATFSGIVSGTGALTKAGAGVVALAGNNTYSGATNITEGTLQTNTAGINATSGLTLNGGTLSTYSNLGITKSLAISLGSNGGTLDLSNGVMSLSGIISGSGKLAISSTNAGNSVTLSGTNTYTGGTTLSNGIVQFNNDAAVGSGTLTINGGKVRASAARTVSNDLVLGGTLTMSGSNAMTFTGNVDLGGADRTIDNSINSDLTFSGILSNGSITIGGSAATGAVVLSGNNTHTNTTIIGSNASGNINTLSVASDASLGSGSITLNGAGAVLKVTGATTIDNALSIGSSGGKIENSAAATLSGVVSGSGAFTKAGAGTLTLSGSNTHTGAVTVSAGTLALTGGSSIGDSSAVTVESGATVSLTGGGETIGSLSGAGAVSLSYTLTVGDSTSTVFSGVISSTNTSGITKVGAGTLTLSGANSYTGATNISAGGLTLNKSGGALSDTTAVTVASGAMLTVSSNDTIGSLAGAGTVALGSSLLTFGGNNTSTTFSGSITGANGGSIKKLGSGTLTLSGTNSYVGGTDLTGGTLVVSSVGALGSGGISFSAGTTLDLAASGTFANYIDLAADATIHVGSGFSATLSNTIDGNGNLTKSGSGTLSLSGSQSATGTMLVSEGTVSVAGDNNLLAGSLTLNGGTLSINGASTIDNSIILGSNGGFVTNSDLVTLSGVISGTGDFSKAGAGTLTLSGIQTATGAMLISDGTLAVADDGNLLAGSLTLNGGSLSITGATTIDNAVQLGSTGAAISTSAAATLSGIISGAGDLRKEGAGTLTLSATQTGTGGVTINGGALAVAGDANLLAGSLTLNGGTLSVTTAGTIDNAITLGSAGGAVSHTAAVTLSGIISGAGDLNKSGSGTLTLTGIQTGTGGLSVSAGTLSVASDANLLAGSLTLNGGTLSVTGSAVTIDNAVVLGSNHGSITNASAMTLSGVISGSGNFSKSGAGALTLSGTNTYTGTSTFAGGTVNISSDSNLGSGDVILGTNGNFTITDTTTIDNNIILNAAPAVISVSTGATATLSGVMSETGGSRGLNKGGSGTLVLGANATYTGGTALNGGVFQLAATTTMATSGITLNNSSPTLKLTGEGTFATAIIIRGNGTNSISVDDAVTLSGLVSLSNDQTANRTLTKTGSGTLTLSNTGNSAAGVVTAGANTYQSLLTIAAGTVAVATDANLVAGTVTLSGGSLAVTGATTIDNAIVISSAGTISSSDAATLSGVISGSSTLTKAGAGALTFSGNNTHTGAINIADGVLAVTSGNAIGDNSAVTVASGATLHLYLADETIGSLSGAGIATLNGGTLTVGGNNTSTTFSGAIEDQESGSLVKAGAGTLTLSGTSTYSGATAVNAGTLNILGALSATSGISVLSGATLTGTGSVFTPGANSTLTVNQGALLAPAGSGTGVLTVNGNLTLNGTLKADITGPTAGSQYDQVLVTGAVALGTNSAFDINYAGSDTDNAYVLIDNDASDAVTGTLNGVADYGLLPAHSADFQIRYQGGTGNDVTLTLNSAPVLTSGTTGTVDENAATNTVIYAATATDANNNTLTYSLTGQDANLLIIDALTGEVRLKSPADYETKASYSFTLVVTDSGNLTASQAVTVGVTDVNEAPVLTSGTTANLDENAATSMVIYTVTATDVDNNTLTYSLSGTDANLLTIDAVTGEVRLKNAADYESKTSYSFIVTASDSGNLSSSQAVTVSVNDLNDNSAIITSGAAGSVNENAATSTVIYTVVASDADGSSAHNTLTYSLSGADADLLTIDAVTGEVRLKASADYEAKTNYSFIVTASDSGNLSSSQAVTVSVNDLNDNSAIITSGATGSVNENAATSTVIYTVVASDADGSSAHNTLTYSLSGADAELLTIDAVTGEVRLKASADYEAKTNYSFIVTASDSGNLSSSQAVTVSVNDLNDNSAIITSGATGSVNENAATSTVIYTVVASDADGSSAHNTLTYSLSGADADLLTIDAVTGEVRLKASANYEAKTSYNFTVTATDSGNLSSSQAVTVSVLDLNDNTAVFSSGATGSVNENAATSTVIYTAVASDADGTSAHNTLTYSLSGADADLLTIDAVTGEVRLKASANYEAKTSYNFTVTATDSGNLSSSQAVTVNVQDLNDNAPSLSAGVSSATLVEAGGMNNTTVGTDNATITLTAADIDTVGSVLYDRTFLLENGWSTADAGATYSKAGTYGTASFTVASGLLSYRLNNSDSVTQALTAGQAVNERFVIQVTDGNASAQTTAVFNLLGSNDAPTVVGTVAPMAGILGQVFNPVSLPETLFTDVDGTESRQLQWSVENLPAGLVFDASSRTIAGTLGGNVTGAVTLQLVATDPNGAQVRTAVVMNIEPAPVINLVVAPPVSVVAPVSPVITSSALEVPTLTFSSLPEGTLSTASGASGFAAAPGQASPIQGLNDAPPAVSNAVVVNVAADGQVQISQAGADLANSGSLTVANMQIQTGQLSIQLADSVGAASYSATLADGSQLPDWVSVNPVTGEVTMTPPPGQGKITLRINAVDANGAVRVLEVEVDLENLPAAGAVEPAPVNAPVETVAAFMPLAQQLNIAAAQADDYGNDLMKLLAS